MYASKRAGGALRQLKGAPTLIGRPRRLGAISWLAATIQAGETPALAGLPPIAVAGRTVTVRVDAEDGHGGRLRRTAIVEFTAAPSRPFLVRGLD